MEEHIAHIRSDGEVQTCREHNVSVAELAGKKLDRIGLKNTAYLAGILHDAGKCTDEFDHYIKEAHAGKLVSKGSVIHSFAGCYYMLKKYHDDTDELGFREVAAEIIAYTIASHHGLFDCVDLDGSVGFEYRLNKQEEYERRALSSYYKECRSKKSLDIIFDEAEKEIRESMIKLLDIADEKEDEIFFYTGMLARLVLSAVIDADRTDTYRFMTGTKEERDCVQWDRCLISVEKYIDEKKCTTEIQKSRRELSDIWASFADNQPDIYRLKMPTGSGKTLSGLRYAIKHAKSHNKKRIFYIAPLISILEQNAEVIKEALGQEDIILEHHSNVVIEDEQNQGDYELQTDRYRLLTENWDVPVIITTLVQFLNTLFGGKTSQIRRFASLADSVILLDEVQTIPLKMINLFNLAMNFLKEICGATIILCSATQPNFIETNHNMRISTIEALTKEQELHYDAVFRRSEIIYDGGLRLEEIPEYIQALFDGTNSLLVVCNKKSESEFLYNHLEVVDGRLFHMSAAMCMAHREKVLKDMREALDAGEKVLCVSTQVIEAGVDISFNMVVRFEAGLDSIVQSNGRCNRHGEIDGVSETHIIRCDDESLKMMREIQTARSAMDGLIYEFGREPALFEQRLDSDSAISKYYENLYRINSVESGYFDYTVKDYPSLFSLLSHNDEWRAKMKNHNSFFLHQAFKTAGSLFQPLDAESISVIVPYDDGVEIIEELGSERAKYDLGYTKSLLDRAKKYSVSIMKYFAKKLDEEGALYKVLDNTVYILNTGFYSDKTGIHAGKEEEACNILIL